MLQSPAFLAAIAGALLLAGCERKTTAREYEVIEGVVVERHADTEEIMVRAVAPRRHQDDDRIVVCILTRESEVYIDDALSHVESLEAGDTIEVIGYRDPNPRLERLVVTIANVTPAPGRRDAPGVSAPSLRPLSPPAATTVQSTPQPPAATTRKEP